MVSPLRVVVTVTLLLCPVAGHVAAWGGEHEPNYCCCEYARSSRVCNDCWYWAWKDRWVKPNDRDLVAMCYHWDERTYCKEDIKKFCVKAGEWVILYTDPECTQEDDVFQVQWGLYVLQCGAATGSDGCHF